MAKKKKPGRTGGVLSFGLLGVQLICFAMEAAHGSSRLADLFDRCILSRYKAACSPWISLRLVELRAFVADQVLYLRDIKNADRRMGAMHGGYRVDMLLVSSLLV